MYIKLATYDSNTVDWSINSQSINQSIVASDSLYSTLIDSGEN